MKFLLDENIGKEVAKFLRDLGHSTLRIKELSPGIEDFEVLNLATSRKAVTITSDKDFGQLIFKEGYPHFGLILLRLQNQTSNNTIKALKQILKQYTDIRDDDFIKVTEENGKFKIRPRKIKN